MPELQKVSFPYGNKKMRVSDKLTKKLGIEEEELA